MKTYVMVFLLVGLTNLTIAQQNDLVAYTPSHKSVNTTSKVAFNTAYLNTVNHQDFAKKIQTFQNAVANYNIKVSDIYQPKSNDNYVVNFDEGGNHITAVYDKNGQLLTCLENYKGIKLPYDLASKLTKDYPNWGIEKVDCKIQYSNQKQQPLIVYQVVMNNENKTKKITLEL